MDLSEKLQKLRKENNLTQEDLAQKLFVSRTAISKWETGRGMPSMESLQLISKYFDISLDLLLSNEEIIDLAKNENKENIRKSFEFFTGIINILAIFALLLPLYKKKVGNIFYSVPLYQVGGFKEIIFLICPSILIICGIIQIFFTKNENIRSLIKRIDILIHIIGIVILILSSQPYPTILFFSLFLMKCLILLKKNKWHSKYR